MTSIVQEHEERFLGWLLENVIREARGDLYQRLTVGPEGRFWLGRLAPEIVVQQSPLGERAERLFPCALGIRVRPSELDGRTLHCTARMAGWREIADHRDGPDDYKWEKTTTVEVTVDFPAPKRPDEVSKAGRLEFAQAFTSASADGLAAEVQAEIEIGQQGPELVVTVVNISPEEIQGLDTNLYEVRLSVDVGPTVPFSLDALPDSFRYDRLVAAYGINGGVDRRAATNVFSTSDYAQGNQYRPTYWDDSSIPSQPDLTFVGLARDPLPRLRSLLTDLERWTAQNWNVGVLKVRADQEVWSSDMMELARSEADRARQEVDRLRVGIGLMETDGELRRAFSLANEAFGNTVSIDYDSWRPFQLGFVIANIASLSPTTAEAERQILDTLWFATGGGKTETYLLFTLIAAFFDRLRGKKHGISSWGRFPLRMLSLQQTQRFADVLAAAELIRQREELQGDRFALGFFVGAAGSPNRIAKQEDNRSLGGVTNVGLRDHEELGKYQILIHCPFCATSKLEVLFDEAKWALEHNCTNPSCPWGQRPLPFFIVDDEIYRWLPTVVLGTLDKAANVSRQAAMRGFYGSPAGYCPVPGHGFTYAPRVHSPRGCLYPGCREQPLSLPQGHNLFGPTVRMQDELHLLRDSLGSIDSHYESLLDDLQVYWGSRPKLIASSATLAGHSQQARALYRREGRMFPIPGPQSTRSFWVQDSDRLARRYIGLAPQGVTLEYANDQLTTTMQEAVRRALREPSQVAMEADVPEQAIQDLVEAYGIGVVYGSTLKDVEAAARSFEAQIPLDDLNSETLTGRTPLDEVRMIIERVKNPETAFPDRIHLIAASSMLSHGVDLDRLNVMVMLGLPLSTAEFIQTTARVGRAHPGLVFVMHKIVRERDAAIFKTFPSFIKHMDRLVDPVPITSKSRRVLELTFSGMEMGRIQGIHEPAALARGLRPLTTVRGLRQAFTQLQINESDELHAMIRALGFEGALDSKLRQDMEQYFREFYRALNDPADSAQWPSDLFPGGGPMLSLRDVEKQIPVYSRGGR